VVLLAQLTENNTPFSLSRSNGQSTSIRFQLPKWELENVEIDGVMHQRVKLENTPYLFIDEKETLPIFTTMIAIPYSGGFTLNAINSASSMETLNRSDFDRELFNERSSGRYSAALYPEANVLSSEPQVLRDYRVVSINVYPFQYDMDGHTLIVNPVIDIQLNYNSLPSVNELSPPRSISRSFEKIYRGLILNYDEMITRNTVYQNPVMLVIYGNYSDATYLSKVNEYITWKKQKGFKVYSASTATTGTSNTAIKAYIQTAYDTWQDRPEYIVLIGDTSGSMPVETFSSYMDYTYTQLAGDDVLGDVVIGRISVETTEQLINYLAKVMLIDRDLNTGTASWLNKILLVGDTASSGISTVYTNRFIRSVSERVNPNYTYTEIYNGAPSSTSINAAITQGVSFYNYRGYIGMSNWPGTMGNMANGYKLFHAVFITCNTGTFGSLATTESVVRLGTEANPSGAVTAIGMATSSTHTPMNNCLDVGIFHALYPLGMRDMGSAMLYGKLYLNAVYGVSNTAQSINFAQFCNLIGDPTVAVRVGISDTFSAVVPASIPSGSSTLAINVKNSHNQAVEGASVSLTNASGVQILEYTNEYGDVLMHISPTVTDSLVLTISKDDFKPTVRTIIINSIGGVAYDSFVIDDDTATGNGDGIVNPGELINLYVSVKNTSNGTILLSGNATCSDPYVTMIQSDRIEFNSIASNAYGESLNPIVLSVAPNCPDDHRFIMSLAIEGTFNTTIAFPVIVKSGKVEIVSHTFVGSSGNLVYPGNVFPLTITLQNTGNADLSNISAILRSYNSFFVIQDSLGLFGNIAVNNSVTNNSNSFQIFAKGSCINGMIIPLELILYNPAGYSQTIGFTCSIGQTSVTEPLGQDEYGYFIFDQGDTGYSQCPAYQWVPIAPVEGGSGTALSLIDPGSTSDEGDQTNALSIQTVNLPFTFTFYGRTYTQASISSNGFIAFGATQDSDWRNWRLPGPGGPNPMIAVFWDDLQLNTGSGVYTYYNSALHYYVVEWYNVISGYDRVTPETFQAILYDPIFYPTLTGDGQIKLQYNQFNNIDSGSGDTYPHGNFCTIGIKDHNGTVGLEYTFCNSYPTAAAPLSNLSSLFITTRSAPPVTPYLSIHQVVIIDDNGNSQLEPAETVSLSIPIVNSSSTSVSNVAGTLSESSPYVTINNASSGYGSIGAGTAGLPLTNYSITVSPSCPENQQIPFTFTITGSSYTWVYNFILTVYKPHLEFGELVIDDASGDNDGKLDPGETVNIIVALNNTSMVSSPSGTANVSCSTPGITIISGSTAFNPVAANSFETLFFSLSASSSMSIGTIAPLGFTATAGEYFTSETINLEIGAPTEVIIGSGVSTQGYPLDRWYNYSAHEAIYLDTEIGMAGTIKSVAFYKASGADVNPIENVSLYLKHTASSSLSTGNYSTAGYTLVYSGAFTNNAESGWMEVNLDNLFEYNGTQNLSLLCIKGFQQYVSNYPLWTYSTTAATRARQNRSDTAAPTSLTATNTLANIRLKVFPAVGILYPAQNLVATPGFAQVNLTWEAPISGTPNRYKIFRNSTLLTTATGLDYSDNAVVNNSSYSYYLKAVYSDGESDASETVNATPYAASPNDISALPGNRIVTLAWQVPDFGTPTGYRIYRNGSLFTSETGLTFYDVDVVNNTTYSYYITAVYGTEESAPTATVQATPTVSVAGFVDLGSGTAANPTNYTSPINVMYRSVHSQFVYTAAELNSAGIVGPINITQIGFDVVSAPTYTLPNFIIRMKHTTATNASSWHTADNLQTVYSAASYTPTAGNWDMLVFSTPFTWNGTDNIIFDTAFSQTEAWDYTGTLRYTSIVSGQRYARNDNSDQTNVFTDGGTNNIRPNLRIAIPAPSQGANISVTANQLNYGAIEIGTTSTQQFTIQNTGDQILAGYVTLPAGYSLSESRNSGSLLRTTSKSRTPTDLRFAIQQDASHTYYLTFTPLAEQSYNGNVVITSNAVNNGSFSISVTGNGVFPTLAIPNVSIASNGVTAVLQWAAIPNAQSYKVYRSDKPAGPFTLVGSTSQLQWTDTWLDKAFYYIKATSEIPTKQL